MRDLHFSLSSSINDSFVKRRTNYIMEKIINLFFMRVGLDEESLLTLQECSKKGKVVYASFQNSVTSLLILVNVIRKNKYALPYIALDFSPYSLQIISNGFKRLYRFFSRVFNKKEFQQITDLEFLEQTVADNRVIVFSLLSSQKFKRRYIDIETDPIQYLVEIQKKTEQPIFVLPQILFWNRNPERTKALLTSSATGDRNLLSAISVNLRSRTSAFIRISSPINLKDEIAEFPNDDSKQIARRVRNKLLEVYSYEKRSILGPVIKSRQEMMEKVLYHKNVLDCIRQLESEGEGTGKKLRKNAYQYFREIAADFSIVYLNYFNSAVQYLFRKIFNGIKFNIEDFKRLREASQTGPLILMPTHKSHMDYLILSSMFYENKLIPPHIVAGSNLLFFPMGKIFRKSGAFFMRRSFKDLKLYAVVFRQYVKVLINEGYSIEFFIEGGRSRNGKMGFPKMGILKYLIESIDEGYNKDMVLVPLTINYDRMLEETSYLSEIKGKEKKAESTSAFMKSRKLLKRKYGSVYLTFGEPVSYQALRQQYIDKGDITSDIGLYITKKINELIVITPFSMVTTALLLSRARGFTKELVIERMRLFHDFFKQNSFLLAESLQKMNFDECLNYVIESYMNDDIIKEMPVDTISKTDHKEIKGLYVLADEARARINIYKNNIVHYLIPLSFVSLSILEIGDGSKLNKIRSTYDSIKNFFSTEFVYHSFMDDNDVVIRSTLDFLVAHSMVVKEGEDKYTIKNHEYLKFFARAIQDFLESYLIVYQSIVEHPTTMARRDFVNEVRKKGITMFHLGEVLLPESLSMPNYNNAIAKALGGGIMNEQRFGKKHVDFRIENPEEAKNIVHTLKVHLDAMK